MRMGQGLWCDGVADARPSCLQSGPLVPLSLADLTVKLGVPIEIGERRVRVGVNGDITTISRLHRPAVWTRPLADLVRGRLQLHWFQ